MASTYSSLKIQLMGTGENSGTWGNITNVNLGTAIEEAITGSADVTFASGTVTLTLTDTNSSQAARNLRLNLTGTSGGAQDLIVPAIEKVYIVNNGCADAITVKNTTGTGIAVPAGKTMYVYNNGTNVVDAITHLTSLTLGSALPIASGGTGSTSTTYANLQSNVTGILPVANGGTGVNTSTGTGSVVLATSPTMSSPTFTGTPLAPTASSGTNTTQLATTAFVTSALTALVPSGSIMLWSGSIGSIPSGWFLCDGSNSTPDLRNRFVVGAGSTYAVNATGGSANATLVSHTHTATSVVTDPQHSHTQTRPDTSGGSLGPGNIGVSGSVSSYLSTANASTGITVATTNSTEGSSATNANLPPYYALAYIMKA
jgi:hypothetical protein